MQYPDRHAIYNNSAKYGGGVKFNGGTSATVTNSVICNNTGTASDWGGGGIYILSTPTEIKNSTIYGNTHGYFGGGLFVQNDVNVTINSSTFTNNTATGARGAGIYFNTDANNSTLKNSIFYDNVNSANAGDIWHAGNIGTSSYNLVGFTKGTALSTVV